MDRTQLSWIFGAESVCTFVFALSTLIFGAQASWKFLFQVTSIEDSIASYCYASVLFGEGTLQYLAFKDPTKYLAPLAAFMVPYKIGSFLTLWSYSSQKNLSITEKAESRKVAWYWIISILPIAVFKVQGNAFSD